MTAHPGPQNHMKMTYVFLWIAIYSCVFLCIPMDPYSALMYSYAFLWIPLVFLWIPMDSYGFLWISMDSFGFLLDSYWVPFEIDGFLDLVSLQYHITSRITPA